MTVYRHQYKGKRQFPITSGSGMIFIKKILFNRYTFLSTWRSSEIAGLDGRLSGSEYNEARLNGLVNKSAIILTVAQYSTAILPSAIIWRA